MHRDDAIALACGPLCLQIHSCLPEAMTRTKVVYERAEGAALSTWLVKGARFLTLIQSQAGTRVYDQEDDLLYYANPGTQLPPECPAGHAFLAQTVEDRQDGAVVPRLLILDLLLPAEEDPRRRAEILRGLAHVFPPSCHVQWSGERAALEQFLSRGMPHEVECIVAMGGRGRLLRDPPAHGIRALQGLAE